MNEEQLNRRGIEDFFTFFSWAYWVLVAKIRWRCLFPPCQWKPDKKYYVNTSTRLYTLKIWWKSVGRAVVIDSKNKPLELGGRSLARCRWLAHCSVSSLGRSMFGFSFWVRRSSGSVILEARTNVILSSFCSKCRAYKTTKLSIAVLNVYKWLMNPEKRVIFSII